MNRSIRNYVEIASSALFFLLGVVILFRSIAETGLFLGVVVGAAFLAYGCYRLRYIRKYFRQRRRTSC